MRWTAYTGWISLKLASEAGALPAPFHWMSTQAGWERILCFGEGCQILYGYVGTCPPPANAKKCISLSIKKMVFADFWHPSWCHKEILRCGSWVFCSRREYMKDMPALRIGAKSIELCDMTPKPKWASFLFKAFPDLEQKWQGTFLCLQTTCKLAEFR